LSAGVVAAASLGLSSPALASSLGHAGAAPHPAHGAFASPQLRTSIVTGKSETFAGYDIPAVDGGATTQAKFVVPNVKCTHTDRGIAASAGAYVGSFYNFSDADVFIGCSNGKAKFFPALTLNNNETNYTTVKLHPGDTVQLKVAVTMAHQTVSVADKTTGVTKSRSTSLSSGVGYPWVGEVSWYKNSNQLGVPNFGKIAFTGAKVAGHSLGSYATSTGLERWNRYDPSFTVLQIKTGKIASTAFKSLFEHS
jgi:hypothetical protein